MSAPLQWLAGDARLRDVIEATINGTAPAVVVAETARRRVLRIAGPAELGPIALKHFRSPGSRRRSNGWKRVLGQTPAAREWRALQEIRPTPIPSPSPLAHLQRGNEEWLAMAFVPGRPFADALERATGGDRRALLDELGLVVRRLHVCGVAHGDLHLGNALLSESGEPVLLDWQRARRTRSSRAHAQDLACLEFSLARAGIARAGRLRVRRAVLGVSASHIALRAAGEHAARFAHDHYRGRTRRCRTDGRQQSRVDSPLGRGMRTHDFSERALSEALVAHDAALRERSPRVLKNDGRAEVTRVWADGRSIIVKRVTKGGLGRRLADPLRGSPAQRGWVGGHGLLARKIDTARPLAWIDRGGTQGSALVLEDLGARGCLDRAGNGEIDPAVLLRLLLALHRRGVDHGDLQASHIYGVHEPALIDLEGIRFCRRLDDAARLRALAELNASLPDAALTGTDRRELFLRYATALPFRMPYARALREVVRRSLARRHAWTGDGCAIAIEPPDAFRPRSR